jgi:hypothetical protein
VLAEIRGRTVTSFDELAQQLELSREDLDAIVGYWIHRGELVVEAACSLRPCATRCPLRDVHNRQCSTVVVRLAP